MGLGTPEIWKTGSTPPSKLLEEIDLLSTFVKSAQRNTSATNNDYIARAYFLISARMVVVGTKSLVKAGGCRL